MMKSLMLFSFTLLLTTALALLPATAQQDDIHIPDDNLASAIRGALDLPPFAAITAADLRKLTVLEAPGKGIADLGGLEHAINLTSLDLGRARVNGEWQYNPMIEDISALANLTQLEWLSLGFTDVSDVSALANLTQLTWLDLWYTAVSDVSALAHLTQLTWLSLRDTAVSDVSVLANLTQLTGLGLSRTAVSDVSALANLTQLTGLGLSRTAVSDVSALANLTKLTRLSLSRTGVSDVSALANLTQLEELWLSGPDVSDISVLANLTKLTELDLWGPDVSDISVLANLTQLTELSLAGTDVSDISVLANLTKLTRLSLAGTGVSDVSVLANLTQLTRLSLRSTAVSDVSPLLGLNLTGVSWDSIGLRLKGCPLSYASIHVHIPAMQEKGIEVAFDNVAHPALLKVSGDAPTDENFVVEATDENGEPIVGKTVLFENLQGGGILSANTVETDARGRAQVTLTLGETAGSNKVKASAEGIQSWVLFSTGATETAPQLAADVNGDGVVNIQDLVFVSGQFGQTGKNSADVNGDGVVNIQDLVLVAAAFGEAAAPALAQEEIETGSLQAADVQQWLRDAKKANADLGGIAALERLLAALMRVEAPPKETALLANYPNPFNPETWIPYQLAEPAEVQVSIYSADGKLVRTLELGQMPAGVYQNRSRAAYWDGRNAQGEPVASGIYFYTLTAGEFFATRKMVIRK